MHLYKLGTILAVIEEFLGAKKCLDCGLVVVIFLYKISSNSTKTGYLMLAEIGVIRFTIDVCRSW